MNHNFQSLYRSLINEEINGTQFLEGLKLIGDFREDLLQVLTQHRSQQDWRNLSRLIWAIGLVPDRKFTPLLCDLLENHQYDGYMEAIADSLVEISDENSVSCIKRSLNHHVYGDDGRHFNRTLIDALYRIGTKEAIEGIKEARTGPDELIRSHAEEFLSRLPGFQIE
jgi:HEAT repeat protein